MKKGISSIFVFLVLVAWGAQPAGAALVNWTDWTSATAGASGSAAGSIGSITVNYAGQLSFAQLGTGDNNYWVEYSPAPYTGNAVVSNAPTPYELIALDRSNVAAANTISFSQSVTNPIMAIVSLGRSNLPVTYDFNTPFVVLSEGKGYWGDGSYVLSSGDAITGYELHAAIQFIGTMSSISWTNSPDEYWHGITVGLAAVPEPATLLLLGLGLVGLAGARRKR